MFIHLAVHHPYTDKADLLAESMRRYGASMRDKPGLQQVYALRDPRTGAMVGLAIWDSKEDWEAARPDMIAAVENDPFGDWEENPPEVFHLDVLFAGKP